MEFCEFALFEDAIAGILPRSQPKDQEINTRVNSKEVPLGAVVVVVFRRDVMGRW